MECLRLHRACLFAVHAPKHRFSGRRDRRHKSAGLRSVCRTERALFLCALRSFLTLKPVLSIGAPFSSRAAISFTVKCTVSVFWSSAESDCLPAADSSSVQSMMSPTSLSGSNVMQSFTAVSMICEVLMLILRFVCGFLANTLYKKPPEANSTDSGHRYCRRGIPRGSYQKGRCRSKADNRPFNRLCGNQYDCVYSAAFL